MSISEQSRDPVEALAAVGKLTEPSLVVLKDFHPFLDSAPVVRAMRELAQDLKSTYTTVILLSPTLTIPVELEKEISVLDVPLPTLPRSLPAAQGDRHRRAEGEQGRASSSPRSRPSRSSRRRRG